MNGILIIILTIRLIDRSLRMDLNQVHNLPVLDPKLGIKFTYILKGLFFAGAKHGLYATVPKEHNIHLCMGTEGYLCMLNHTL